MDKARIAIVEHQKNNPDDKNLNHAWQELWVCQGSDWYWWYGEPNDSGQDDIFDHLFREHLKNIYKLIKQPIPDYLEKPLTEFTEIGSRHPMAPIENFALTGTDPFDKWSNCGCLDIPAPPTMQEKRFLNKICFGYDEKNLYLRFDVNKFILDKNNQFKDFNQIYIYLKNKTNTVFNSSPIRVVNKTETILPLLKENYNSEVKLTLFKNYHFNAQLSQATKDNLWVLQIKNNIEHIFKDFIEIKIPFEDLRIKNGEVVEFIIIQGPLGIVDDFHPQNSLLSVLRPANICVEN
jgi:hypothetical protein